MIRNALLVALLFAVPARAQGHDLREVYPATMSWSQSGLFPVCEADDVWELDAFEFSLGKKLSIECKQASVAFGRHETNVLWAVVFPAKPARIKSSSPGDGEKAETVFLRFAPAELNQVFPPKTVKKRGDPWLRSEAMRIARRKIGWKWSTPAGNPTIVQSGWFLVDVDTVEGPRRFYGVDRNAGQVEYVAEFEDKPVPDSAPISKKDALAAFDEVWEQFDESYAGFTLLPELDWDRLGKDSRTLAGRSKTVFDVAAVLADMLAQLQDLHVWVKAGDDWLPGYSRERPLNGNWQATQKLAGATEQGGENLSWGRTEDGIGYLGIHGLNDAALPDQVDAALEELKDTRAMIVDLRFNGGGDELLARAVAGRFVDAERVYSLNQYRTGPKHDQLGEKLERKLAPRGPWRYEQPVVCLFGQRTLSSAESMALMFAQCPQVTTMGDRTGGSSANPRRIELECGVTVNQPRWLDMDPEGNPIEHVGVPPQVPVGVEPDSFSNERDPVMEAALARLRKAGR